jgi:hypothetical protein
MIAKVTEKIVLQSQMKTRPENNEFQKQHQTLKKNKQTNKQTNKTTNKQTNKQTNITYLQLDRSAAWL